MPAHCCDHLTLHVKWDGEGAGCRDSMKPLAWTLGAESEAPILAIIWRVVSLLQVCIACVMRL